MSVTVILGGTVVLADRLAANHDVIISDGRIVAIEPSCERVPLWDAQSSVSGGERGHRDGSSVLFSDELTAAIGRLQENRTDEPSLCPLLVDARGCYVMPGFIDIHSDYIESVASPRPGVVMDLSAALYEADRALVAQGVTTIFHSLSIYGLTVFDHKPIRRFENVSRLIEQIGAMREREADGHLIRHRMHLRVELDAVARLIEIHDYLLAGKVDLLSFMDHTPGQGQYRDLEVFVNTLRGYKRDISDEAAHELIRRQQGAAKLSLEQMRRLIATAHEQGIAVASHDDDSADKLELMQQLGVSISEFPISLAVAREAARRKLHTVAGAPNVLLGHSHSGNLSAREAVCAGAADILCSDYYPAALLRAVFTLHHDCNIALPDAVALVTLNPARATGLDAELGEIAVGKRGDILVVREHAVTLSPDAAAARKDAAAADESGEAQGAATRSAVRGVCVVEVA
ncbi:MAG: alpha-D-ribose 1-methylphosphonate 5-triphosphate diphosphatase, partial [Coriobacteriales bacterium]|nr:alpha-D-ribose 1-methylphosphonate 5-triphosphate diphosphatase [Coriobacteriales bacterium]